MAAIYLKMHSVDFRYYCSIYTCGCLQKRKKWATKKETIQHTATTTTTVAATISATSTMTSSLPHSTYLIWTSQQVRFTKQRRPRKAFESAQGQTYFPLSPPPSWPQSGPHAAKWCPLQRSGLDDMNSQSDSGWGSSRCAILLVTYWINPHHRMDLASIK